MIATDDAQLLDRLLCGEEKAYRHLVAANQGAMRAVAYAIVGRSQVDDVVQEAWLSVVRGLKEFQGRSCLKTWILTITSNAAKCRYLQKRREALLNSPPSSSGFGDERFSSSDAQWGVPPVPWHQDSPEALIGESELYACINQALEDLSELQRSVLVSRECSGLELTEIARIHGLSLSNVRVLLHRARLKVFASIEGFQLAGEF
ncbi:RNA polymerase sigma factor [Pseudomonas gingeri]|uniref:RNA polymerase sigma factor n=1 Tax=Pseudomonas gingeri TaxID=117681 RepID=UPI0015A3F9D4|nr:RNA polymerase sigma factor [Pseudomonas gingeri]NWD72800.1 RNA polymerase sigma factor [Pseudomonas gingeri]